MPTVPATRRPSLAIAAAGFIGVALVPFLAVGSAVAQRAMPGAGGPAKLPPPLPIDAVESILSPTDRESIRGIVEELVTRKLAASPPVGIVEPNAMRLAAERSMRASEPTAKFDPAMLNQLAQRGIAIYDPSTKSIFIGSGGLALVGEPDRRPVARMLYAQALVHAILDQELSLGSYTRGATPETSIARRMLTEGLAVTARDRLGLRLGFNPFASSYRPHLPGIVESREGASLERSLYGTGRLVVEARWNAEGIESVWSLLAKKPSTVRELAMEIPRSKLITAIQATLDPVLKNDEWRRARLPVAPSMAVAAMKGLTEDERAILTLRSVTTETLGYSRSDGAAALFSAIRTVDDAAVRTLAGAIAKMPATLESDLTTVGAKPQLSRTQREVDGLAIQVVTVTVPNDPSAKATTFITAGKGSEMIIITLSGATLPTESLDKVLAAMAAHLGAATDRRAE